VTSSRCNAAHVARLLSVLRIRTVVGLYMVAAYFLRREVSEVHIAYRAVVKFERETGDVVRSPRKVTLRRI
jgi:hypothetical protein